MTKNNKKCLFIYLLFLVEKLKIENVSEITDVDLQEVKTKSKIVKIIE